ncbi:Ribosomal RNA-processing protein 7 [Podila humilis]|nr:Ribosomal RNA-processing protein 7 [Podila humilis]
MVSKKSKKSENFSSSSTALDQISNFHILPLCMPALTTSASSYDNVIHYLYFKKHESPKTDAKTPKDRSLFVLNVPVDATETHFRELFKPYGRVASVHFINRNHDSNLTKEEREHHEELERLDREMAIKEVSESKPVKGGKKSGKKSSTNASTGQEPHHYQRNIFASGSQAYVVFLDELELAKVLNMKRKKRSWIDTGSEDTNPTSLEWIREYHDKRPAAATLQIKVDEYMEKFERSEYEAQQAALARLNVMDDDGFTLVTSAGSKGANSDGVISIKAVKAEDVKHIKPKKKELQDFYRFQMREAKRDKLVDLRRKFEEDKIRIEALKTNRRFKPY